MEIDNDTTLIILGLILVLLLIWYFRDKHVPKLNSPNPNPIYYLTNTKSTNTKSTTNTESISVGGRTSSHSSALIAAPFNS